MELSDLVYIDATGYHYADYPAFLQYFTDEYKNIYGQDVYLEPDSQDGQNIAIKAKAAYDAAALGSSVYSSFSPVSAQGVGLSRNVKINGLNRRVPTFSTVDLTIVGQAGTVLGTVGNPAIAEDTLGQKWDIPVGTTIPGGGSIVVTATAQELGAINAEAATVTKIFTPTLGWQTVNNVTAASPGEPVETDAELRARQEVSTANPSLTVLDGSNGAVANLDGVTKVRSYENDTDTTDGNGITEHSVATMVLGGDNTEIAETIARHKTPGAGTFGTTSVVVEDSRGMPLNIKFTRPDQALISVRITLVAGTGWSSDFEDQIAAAVAAVINSLQIGESVLLTRLFAPAYLFGTAASETFDIVTIELKKNAGSFVEANISIDFDEYAFTDAATDITFIVT